MNAFCSLLVCALLLLRSLQGADSSSCSKVESLLDLRDYKEAYRVAEEALDCGVYDDQLWQLAIRSAFYAEGEAQALLLWKKYLSFSSQVSSAVAEEVALGIVRAHYFSSSPILRAQALLTSMQMQTKESVEAVLLGMEDPHLFVRSLVLQNAGAFRDRQVLRKVAALLKKENTSLFVAELARLAGAQKNAEAKKTLLDLLFQYKEQGEMRNLIFTALGNLEEKPSPEKIDQQLKSNESALIELALWHAYQHPNTVFLPALFQCLSHKEPSIREKALLAIAKQRFSVEKELYVQNVTSLCSDPYFAVKLTALYTSTLLEGPSCDPKWKEFLLSGTYENRLLASGYLAATGPAGLEISREVFDEVKEPLLRLHLALHLLAHGDMRKEFVDAIEQILKRFNKKLRLVQHGPASLFSDIAAVSMQLPLEMVDRFDLQARLSLVGILLFKDPSKMSAIRSFFRVKSAEVTLMALELALKEGGWSWAEEIRQLLKDPDPDVRFHAAALLGLNGEPSAEEVLQEALCSFDQEKKVLALRVMGKVKTEAVSHTLFSYLCSPSSRLRLSAAAGLIDYYNY